jgi:uncharacterized protein DUF1116
LTSIERANAEAVKRIQAAHPWLEDLRPARDAIPALRERRLLHAGPPITWERMCGPMRGAVIGAALYEGWAETPEAAEAMAARGEIAFDPCHHHGAVGPMAGIVGPSMPVFVVRNRAAGNLAFSTMNEGLGKVLRYGAYDTSVLDRLRWMHDWLAPPLTAAIREAGGFDLRALIAQALQMGDECHNRNKAATSLFFRGVAPHLLRLPVTTKHMASVADFLNANDAFFLNLAMAACKCTADAAHGMSGSTVVTSMARNGTDFGIRVSGLGNRWFTAPSKVPVGLFFPGFTQADANPDIGDSAITETAGLGGFAMAAAPAIASFVGGTADLARTSTLRMYEITLAENEAYRIPALDFRGTPTAIDLRKVVETGILPVINTGIAHRNPGVGQVGAGLTEPPAECFHDALAALVEEQAASR